MILIEIYACVFYRLRPFGAIPPSLSAGPLPFMRPRAATVLKATSYITSDNNFREYFTRYKILHRQ